MGDTLFFNTNQLRYPYWVNMPPTVPRYPASQDMFRRSRPERLTYKTGKESFQNWTDGWYDYGYPIRRDEELPKVAHPHEPCSCPWQYQLGPSAIPLWKKEGKDWPISSRYLRSFCPPPETLRARAFNRLRPFDDNLYPFSNYMTSTYRRPVYGVSGPMQKAGTFGLTHQHNRHGFMTFEDYY